MSAHSLVVLIVHVLLAAVGVVLIVTDARTHRLPDRIVLPTLAASVLLVALEALATGTGERALRAVIGALALGCFYALLHLSSRQGMGGGDVKLAAVIGLVLGWHGWGSLLLGSAAAFVLGAGYALVLMGMRLATRTTRIAFGPWMILGAACAIAIA